MKRIRGKEGWREWERLGRISREWSKKEKWRDWKERNDEENTRKVEERKD